MISSTLPSSCSLQAVISETIGQVIALHDEGVVAGDPQRILQSLNTPSPMADEEVLPCIIWRARTT